MNKLNFGCGIRFASGWTNLDFHGDDVNVRRANLLRGFPFADGTFDAVYSSHVLEHFTPEQGRFLVREAHRVLKSGGILRTVVPDLESSCREYIRILEIDDSDEAKPLLYAWTKIELLDQLVRRSGGGCMGPFIDSVSSGNSSLRDYIFTRIENCRIGNDNRSSALKRLRQVTAGKLRNKLLYAYLGTIKRMIPRNLRPMLWTETSIGEKHQWMYDKYGMALLMQETGFEGTRFLDYNESGIRGFREDKLDENADGTPYKRISLYCEAIKA